MATVREILGRAQAQAQDVIAEESIGRWVVDRLLPNANVRKIGKLADPQTGQLAMQVWAELVRRIDAALGAAGEEALNRMIAGSNFEKDTSGQTRNNVFKAANALGVKLPSGSF